MTLDDHEHQNRGFIDFFRYRAATHITRVNCAEISRHKPEQPAFSALNLDFSSPSLEPLASRKLAQ